MDSMDAYLDWLIPKIRPLGEDLHEQKHYVNRPWLEFQDNDRFHDVVLHFFNEGGEYLHSVNGDVSMGQWRIMEGSNKLLIDHKDKNTEAELFDLAYMDKNFFILKKHGFQPSRGKHSTYFVLAHEPLTKNLEWRDLMELMYNTYRSNNQFYFIVALIVLLSIALILMLSVG